MRLFIYLLCLHLCSLEANSETLRLDTRKSAVNFDLSSQVFSTTGSFNEYSGELKTSDDKIPNKLTLVGNVSKFSVPTLPLQGKLLISNLLNLLSTHEVKFVSDSIIRKGGTFEAQGMAYASGKREDVTFPFKAVIGDNEEVIVTGSYSKSGPVKASKVSPLPLGIVRCDADFRLVFR